MRGLAEGSAWIGEWGNHQWHGTKGVPVAVVHIGQGNAGHRNNWAEEGLWQPCLPLTVAPVAAGREAAPGRAGATGSTGISSEPWQPRGQTPSWEASNRH